MKQLVLIGPALLGLIACAENSAAPYDDAVEISIQEEVRIGALEGAEEYSFGYVSTVAPGAEGRLYIADSQVPVIRAYDVAGRYLHDVGRRGQGPGEYLAVDGMAVGTDGQLTVWDSRNGRISRFETTGVHIDSFPLRLGLGGWRGFVWSPNGPVFIRISPETGFTETPDGLVAAWARIGPRGATERVASIPPEDRVGPRYVLSGRGGYYRPFVLLTLSTIGPDGSFYQVRNDEYRIRRRHPDGTESHIVRAEAPIRVGEEELAQWEAWSEYFARRSPEQRSNYFPIPEIKPFIRELLVDPEGRLWVARYTEPTFVQYSPEERADRDARGVPDYQWREKLRWDVFDPGDAYLGSVTLPPHTSLVTARGDLIWGIQSGPMREDYVVRWRMVDSQ